MSEVTKENMLFHLKHGCSFYPVCPICNAIRVLIEEHGKFKEENIMLLERIENLKHGLIEHGPKVEIETAFFEIYKEGRRKYWFGAEAGWKGGAEVGEKGVLMMNAKHFKAGTIIRVYEP